MRLTKITVIAACCLSLTSCFTGIESTPRITDRDVRRNTPVVDKEADFAATLLPQPVGSWTEGHRFLVTDGKLSLLFEKEPKLIPGDVLIFMNLSPEISITGDTISVLSFCKYGGEVSAGTMRYKVGVPPRALSTSFSIPLTVDLDMVDDARRKLLGNKYYIISSLRVDSTLTPTAAGRRYVPVTVDDVVPGNADYPLRLDITDDTGAQSSVAMTVGTSRSATRNFDKIFEIDNPRLRYPAITDATWNNIVNSRAVPGMTLDECHLALGSPRDIRKWHNGGSFFEGWTYDNGRYYIFEDGLLSVVH